MASDSIAQRIASAFRAWGPSALSHAALSASQILLAATMRSGVAILLFGLAAMGLLMALAHKGASFEQAAARARKGKITLPWSHRTTQLAVSGVTMVFCAQLAGAGLLGVPALGYAGALVAALAGWLAGLRETPKPSA